MSYLDRNSGGGKHRSSTRPNYETTTTDSIFAHGIEGNSNVVYLEGNIVLVYGYVFNSKTVFQAHQLTYPPAEDYELSRKALGMSNMASLYSSEGSVNGGSGDSGEITDDQASRPEYWEQLREYEEKNAEHMMITLSDVNLDKTHVIEQLSVLFSTYENIYLERTRRASDYPSNETDEPPSDTIPPTFILMGTFITQPDILSYSGRELALSCWDMFAKLLIASCPHLLCVSKFIFIPSPRDVYCTGGGGSSASIPLFPLSKLFTESFTRQITQHILTHVQNQNQDVNMTESDASKFTPNNIIFTTNPSKIHYFSQEIVIFREELMRKMQKHAVFLLSEEELSQEEPIKLAPKVAMISPDLEEDEEEEGETHLPEKKDQILIECILDQGHLASLPLLNNIAPIYWSLDDTLRLFPLPQLVCYVVCILFSLFLNVIV